MKYLSPSYTCDYQTSNILSVALKNTVLNPSTVVLKADLGASGNYLKPLIVPFFKTSAKYQMVHLP